jgi:hypothetical protein
MGYSLVSLWGSGPAASANSLDIAG